MRLNRENQNIITSVAVLFLLISVLSQRSATATEALDNDVTESDTVPKTPYTVPLAEPRFSTEPSEDAVITPEAREPAGISPQPFQGQRTPIAPGSGQPTYSIRLPLGVAGSVLPRLDSGKPGLPPSGSVMPNQRGPYNNNIATASQDFNRPVAWRATAEAIRTQTAGPSLQIATIASDFKTAYTTMFREAPQAGWSVASLSLPAGHFLLRMPKPNESSASEDAAAWLVVLLSPIDSRSTEIRVKIQSRRPSVYAAAVSNFINHCQMKASGNELL